MDLSYFFFLHETTVPSRQLDELLVVGVRVSKDRPIGRENLQQGVGGKSSVLSIGCQEKSKV